MYKAPTEAEYKELVRVRTEYEFWFERIVDGGDIEDTDPIRVDEIAEYLAKSDHDVCLQRITGSESEGITDRGYAYFRDGAFETTFDNGYDVPKKWLAIANRILNK